MGAAKGGFTVNPDGSINAASVEDALNLSEAILARQQPGQARGKRIVRERTTPVNRESSAQKFIQTLEQYSGKEIGSEQLAKIVGVDSAAAVGPKIRHLRAAFEKEDLSLADYLESSKEGRAPTVWKVK